MSDAYRQQLLKDYGAFRKMKFPDDQTGRYALLRNCELVEVFGKLLEAHRRGDELFGEAPYSIYEINQPPVVIPSVWQPDEPVSGLNPDKARRLEQAARRELEALRRGESKLVDLTPRNPAQVQHE